MWRAVGLVVVVVCAAAASVPRVPGPAGKWQGEPLIQAPDFVGLGQVNIRLPRSLPGRGEVDVELTVDGKTADTVRVNVR